MVITQCDCPEKCTTLRTIPLYAGSLCYNRVSLCPHPCAVFTSATCSCRALSCPSSLCGMLADSLRSTMAIWVDILWSWISSALKYMLKGFSELGAVCFAGSLHISWLPERLASPLLYRLGCSRCPRLGPSPSPQHSGVPHKVGCFGAILCESCACSAHTQPCR